MTETRQHWLFRVAALSRNGGGHVSRSLVLAREVAKRADVSFSIPVESPYASEIEASGFQCVSPEKESDIYDGIWMDVYEDDFERYRKKTNLLVLIEDHKDLYPDADIYIRPFPGNFVAQVRGRIWSGLGYALVNPVFFGRSAPDPKPAISTITVFMGRYDSINGVERMLGILRSIKGDFKANVVMGSSGAHLESVRTYLETAYHREYKLHIDLPDLVSIFLESDLLILSGGVAALEACALRVPAVVVNIAENQILLSRHLGDLGVVFYAGRMDHLDDAMIEKAIETGSDYDVRCRMVERSRGILDGRGPERIAEILTAPAGEVRHAAN